MRKIYSDLLLIVLIIFSFLRLGCMDLPGKLVMPQWNVDLNVPIVNRSYDLSDIIKNQNYISVEDSGTTQSIYYIQSDNYSISKDVSAFIKAMGSKTDHESIESGSTPKLYFVQFPGNVEITNAIFSSGTITYKLVNPSSQNVTVSIEIPGITINKKTFSEEISVMAKDSVSNNIDMTGAVYTMPQNQPAFFKNSLEVQAAAASDTAAKIEMYFTNTDFFFSSATGYLPSKSLGVKSNSFYLNLKQAKDYRNEVTLKNADLNISAQYIPAAENNNPFQIEVTNLVIKGIMNNGKTFQLQIPDSATTFIFSGKEKNFDFNASNSNITDFLSFLPDSINVSAEYIMNPNDLTGTVTAGDSVKFSAKFSTTSSLAINNYSSTDTSSIINISEKDREKIRDSQAANLNINIINGIPLGSSFNINITDSLYHTLFTIKNYSTNTDLFSVSPAVINQSGNVTSAASSSFSIQLDSAQTEMLSHAWYAVYSINIKSPDYPTPVVIRPNDKIQIQVDGGLKYRINDNSLK